jgi:hypothetical protein
MGGEPAFATREAVCGDLGSRSNARAPVELRAGCGPGGLTRPALGRRDPLGAAMSTDPRWRRSGATWRRMSETKSQHASGPGRTTLLRCEFVLNSDAASPQSPRRPAAPAETPRRATPHPPPVSPPRDGLERGSGSVAVGRAWRARVGGRGRGASTAPVRGEGESGRGSLCAGVINARGDFALSVTGNPPQPVRGAPPGALARVGGGIRGQLAPQRRRLRSPGLRRELTSPAELKSRQSSGWRAASQLCGAPVALFETKSPRSAGGSRTPAFPLLLTSRSTRLHPRPRASCATAP